VGHRPAKTIPEFCCCCCCFSLVRGSTAVVQHGQQRRSTTPLLPTTPTIDALLLRLLSRLSPPSSTSVMHRRERTICKKHLRGSSVKPTRAPTKKGHNTQRPRRPSLPSRSRHNYPISSLGLSAFQTGFTHHVRHRCSNTPRTTKTQNTNFVSTPRLAGAKRSTTRNHSTTT
jgi:hypothetical protein